MKRPKLTEAQVRAILACSGFELAAPVDHAPDRHPLECECDACQRQANEPKQ